MSNKRDMKLYPSTEHCQYPGETALPLAQAIAYLTTLQQAIPAEDRPSATLEGWNSLEVWYTKTLTPLEVAQEKLAHATAALTSAEKGDLRQDELLKLLRRILVEP